jgi:transglutaminase-like putative cysteine protease
MVAAAFCAAFPAQAAAPIDPPARILVLSRTIDVAADGSWTMATHVETKVLQAAAIAALAQTPLNYSDTLQTLEVTQAHTLKADGTSLAVAPDAIITRQSPSSKDSPLLTDLKQKVILYPNVEVGDTLAYDAITRTKPLIAGNFFYNTLFPSVVAVERATITIRLPKAMAATVDERGFTVRKSSEGDSVVYTARYSNSDPSSSGSQAVSEFDRAARFTLSTFKDYDALAQAYAPLALPAMNVTPAIQQQADRITQGVSDRYQQARLIYDWVAAHVRYVAVEFGQGGIVPHNADTVLTNAYGDCKDHAALFSALLKAKGIDSKLAIVNATDSYTIAQAPDTVPFNHMITWLPEFKLYADTTAGRMVPFGLLPRAEYGKEAIHVGDESALHEIPLPDAERSLDTYKLTIRMDEAGHIESESSSTATGDFATPLRQLGALLQGENGKKLAHALLQKSPMPRATGAFMAEPPDLAQPEYKISATYATPNPLAALAAGSSFRLGDNLKLIAPVSAILYGPVLEAKFKNADPVPCYSGRSIDDESLEFPATRHLDKLPEDVSIHTSHVSYSSHWSQTPTSVSVHREFTARFDEPVCSARVRDEVRGAVARIQADDRDSSFTLSRN